jgi:regulator of sirC expression with transglutaminase-like and TPR domain
MRTRERPERTRFRAFVADGADDDARLAEGALLIAAEGADGLDVAAQLARLEGIVAKVAPAVRAASSRHAKLVALGDELWGRLGFRGNTDDYYDESNSFLSEVLTRRVGLPITLSVVYLHVGRAAGLSLAGVGFPGHFLIRTMDAGVPLFLDPFDAGRIRTAEELGPFLLALSGGRMRLEPEHLLPVRSRAILVRMLSNLKALYVGRADWFRAIDVVDRILLLKPEAAEERRDRGALYARLGSPELAIDDLEAYLASGRPDAEARREAQALLVALRRRAQSGMLPS